MMNKYFGELEYNYGWLTKREILLFGNKHEITVIIQAYKAEDEIPTIQDEVCKEYAEHEQEYLEWIEKLMLEFDDNADTRFTPDSLYIERDGKCALLCDDAEDLDDGIAVEIIPEKNVTYQNVYL